MDLHMLTTTDNPFSPISDYDAWLTWDMAHYNSNALLGRVAYTSPDMSPADQAQAIEDAIDEIVTENVSGVHTKVRTGSDDSSSIEHEAESDDFTTQSAA